MKKIIIVKPENCVGCNACVRNCPAPEANITKMLENGNFVTTVNDEKCIACGECVKTCSHGARDYIDDTREAMEMIGKQQMIVIVAPAIKAVLKDNWKSVLNWFKNRNCLVFDVSFGADICTWAHLRTIEKNRIGNIISQPCAAIVKYIETYQPSLIKNLSPIHSPMLCTAIYIKKYLQYNNKIIALSPCVAKKNEFEETRFVDFNVTFKKLMEYFDRNGITIQSDYGNDFKYEFEQEQGQYGGVYPKIGGLRDNLLLHNLNIDITVSEGVHKVYPELDAYAELAEIQRPQVFDVLSCEYGCNVGAGTGTERTIFDIMHSMRGVEEEAKSRRKTAGGFFNRGGGEDKLFKRFDAELNIEDFIRTYKASKPLIKLTRDELIPIYKKMGKNTKSQRSYNCHACGYHSCEEMATAIFKGLNVPENCIVYAKETLARQNEATLLKRAEYQTKITELKSIVDDMQQELNGAALFTTASSELSGGVKLTIKTTKNLSEKITEVINSSTYIAEKDVETLKQLFERITAAFSEVEEHIGVSTNNTLKTTEFISKMKEDIKKAHNFIDEFNS